MRLLLIDDSKSSLRALQQTVEGCATTVESYTDPIEAIQRARKTRFDLVVTDFMMPQMDGLEVIKKLRKLDGYAGMPAVVVTSQKDRDLHLALLKASATDILTKPFDKAELRARIENLLALRRSQKKLENENLSLKESVEAAERRSAAHGEEIVWCLARAMASRDGNTGNHVERVAMISELIAQGLGLSDELCRMIFLAAPLS